MHSGTDMANSLADQVRAAAASKQRLAIHGHGTKLFYTGELTGEPLDVTGHRGIVSYEPTELVITARAGTSLADIEAALTEQNQMLGFEPPHFGENATLGGTIACGLSGPRRPYTGAARDFVLGTHIINGRGERLKFGGQVMKNVAGFDASRLMAGSLGTLGVILDVSLKVLPRPEQEITLCFHMPTGEAIRAMNTWAGQPLPLSAAACRGDTLYIRLSGTAAGVRAAQRRLGGNLLENSDRFWTELREHRLDFFRQAGPLWRVSVPPAAPPLPIPGEWLMDWGGARRWLVSDVPAATILEVVHASGGHAMRIGDSESSLSALPDALQRLQHSVRQAFDPYQIFAPGSA